MKVKDQDIISALKDSEEVEISKNEKQLRRKNNAPLPAMDEKKRDTKAAGKEEEKKKKQEGAKEEESDVELDEKGNPVLINADFENP